jgi:hypothetical protein
LRTLLALVGPLHFELFLNVLAVVLRHFAIQLLFELFVNVLDVVLRHFASQVKPIVAAFRLPGDDRMLSIMLIQPDRCLMSCTRAVKEEEEYTMICVSPNCPAQLCLDCAAHYAIACAIDGDLGWI